jgi:cytochrome c peroxidase
MNSKRKELLKSPAWQQAMHLIRSVAAITLGSICLLAISDVGRTHTRATPKLRAENHALPLFAAVFGEAKSPSNLGGQMPPSFDKDVARVVTDIDRIEADTLTQMGRTGLDRQGQVHTLGKLLIFDKHLSVNQNEACSFCHTPETGFTGPIQSLNETTVSYPGSVRTRFSNRKPQSYMYAPFAPVLHYNALQGDFVGGNFWDMRASGYHLQNPSAEQAQGPPTNPVEMGLPDSACVAYRLSKAPYRKLFETVWGTDSFTIEWPPDVERV